MDNERLWQAKLAAWTHDPAEKALVLLRDPSGHEGGTVRELRQRLFGAAGVPEDLANLVRRADHWASAADRPQFPRTTDGSYADWAQVRFTDNPVLIHPLSGRKYCLLKLADVPFKDARAVSLDHFDRLIARDGEEIDYRRTFLAFWRNGPASPHGHLGVLWGVLPADTRVPDHTIWDHLQLTSALAGAMAADPAGCIALMAVSIGPVQSFIEQGRSTSDLWAGSHLLARLSWEALRVVCERFGPDSVIFPHLHGVPLVDLWLRRQGIEIGDDELDELTDANPAFVASLPNRFVAIVPEAAIHDLAAAIERSVRSWVRSQGASMAKKLVERAGVADPDAAYHRVLAQIQRQLLWFPELHWAAVPWRLAGSADKVEATELSRIAQTLAGGTPEGALLDTPAWRALSREIELDGWSFYKPNPGVLYPDLYQVLDRLLAATKATRIFDTAHERGYRCSLCGEREWLTDDDAILALPRGQRKDTLWMRIGERYPSWARKGEHLCALCALKRLWPALFADDLSGLLGPSDESSEAAAHELQRFVVSTHTMALAPTLDRMVEVLYGSPSGEQLEALGTLRRTVAERKVDDFVALPKRLADELTRRKAENVEVSLVIRRLPALLDRLGEEEDEEGRAQAEVRKAVKCVAGAPAERYYALVLLDGDHMGAWLSGSERETQLRFEESWHPDVVAAVKNSGNATVAGYQAAMRPPSPARHAFISRALNGFAIRLARLIVEERYNGKLLYAGGDDVLAMVAVDDLLDVLFALRCAYSGIAPGEDVELKELLGRARPGPEVRFGGDHVLVRRGARRELLRTMGAKATLSAGAVIAHYAAPLGRVLRELRAAERRAKSPDGGGRDAFSVTVMKRAGGHSVFTSKWFPVWRGDGDAEDSAAAGTPTDLLTPPTSIGLLSELRDAFASHLSRRAAYHLIKWLQGVGPDVSGEELVALLGCQFARQAKGESLERGRFQPTRLAEQMVQVAVASATRTVRFIQDALTLAEFLAREGRAETSAGA